MKEKIRDYIHNTSREIFKFCEGDRKMILWVCTNILGSGIFAIVENKEQYILIIEEVKTILNELAMNDLPWSERDKIIKEHNERKRAKDE